VVIIYLTYLCLLGYAWGRVNISDVMSQDFEVAEEQIRQYENETGALLRSFGDTGVDEAGFQCCLDRFGRNVHAFRKQLMVRSEYIKLLQEMASQPNKSTS